MSKKTLPLESKPLLKNNISTSEKWQRIWQQHFGDKNSGFWQPNDKSDLSVPYRLDHLKVFGIKMKYANAATNSHSPRFDIIGQSDEPDIIFKNFIQQKNVGHVVFPYLAPNSTLMGFMPKLKMLHSIDECETAVYAETTGDWDEYWTNRGSSRRELGRRERKFLGKEGARFEVLTDWQSIEPLFHNILKIESSGWKGKQGSAIIQNKDTLNFYTEFCKYCADHDYLRLFILHDNDIPVAFEINVEFNGILHCFKHGYLDEYSKQGAGQVLRIQVMKYAFEKATINHFDMFGPYTDAKRKWATHTEQLYTLRIYANSLSGWLAWLRFSLAPKIKKKLIA